MDPFSLIVLLMVSVVVLAALAQRLDIAYPIVMILTGGIIAIAPGLPGFELDPHLALVLFLPPVLFEAAYFTSVRSFRANLSNIAGLALGGVFVTMAVVGAVVWVLYKEMDWPVALALGAIVAPPDSVAASTVMRRVGAPHRVRTILEGESLVNDSSALTAYRMAVIAATTGTFSPWEASLQFVLVLTGGIAVGLAAGWLMSQFVLRLMTSDLEIATMLVAPFAIYVLAEELHVSGVLAVVAAGMYMGRDSSRVISPESRVGGYFTWQTVLVLFNGIAFVLMGMQIRYLIEDMELGYLGQTLGKAVIIGLAVIVARFLWLIPAQSALNAYRRRKRRRRLATRASTFIIGWAGLRGIVTLASAMALPFTTDAGDPFPFRTEIVLIAFVVICMTLLGQGMFLPLFIDRLGLRDRGEFERELWRARRIVAEASAHRLTELAGESWVPRSSLDVMMRRYEALIDEMFEDEDPVLQAQARRGSVQQLRHEVVVAGRHALRDASQLGLIGEEARAAVDAELDRELIRP